MSELLIPFGIEREAGEIIEPEDAPKGRACNCLCPGCKAPLLSRHPQVKRYHFAHDSRHKDAKPEVDCPFSSAVAVAMMVREVAAKTVGKTLVTPPLEVMEYYSCCGASDFLQVSHGARNTIDSAKVNVKAFGHHADLMLDIAGHPILVDLVYKGKPSILVNESELQSNKAALLTLDCHSFSISSLKSDRNLRFSEAVLAFVLQEGFKEWAVHPKTASVLERARRDHQCAKQEPYRYIPKWKDHHRVAPIEQKPESTKRKPVRYQCFICHVEWMHDFRQKLGCPKCQNHLYAREIS